MRRLASVDPTHMIGRMADGHVTAAELEAALEALQEPGRFDAAERLVGHLAPGLHRMLVEALAAGGWGPDDDLRELERVLATDDPAQRRAGLLQLLGEQTRVAMFVGVAVGIELARELRLADEGARALAISHHGDQGAP